MAEARTLKGSHEIHTRFARCCGVGFGCRRVRFGGRAGRRRSSRPGARLTLFTARQNGVGVTDSSADGRFRFDDIQPDSYVLIAEKPGFATTRTAVRLEAGRPADVTVTLAIQTLSSEVTVTAETGLVGSTFDVAQQVNLIDRGEIGERVHTVAIEALREEPGVDIQRTVPVMGGVAVRGLLGKNVAVYRDGVRYTTSAQRGGVSTFLNLTESTNLDAVEVLRGPNSAQYGSDSLGGTINFLSRPASTGSARGWSGEVAPAYSSASHTFGGNVLASYGGPRFGMVTNLASRRQNTWRSGQGIESHAAVARFLGLPSDVLGERSTDTAFTQYGGMFHAQAGLSPRQQLVFHYERSQQDGGKRWDQLLGGDGNLIADLRNLMLDFGYARYTRFQAGPFDQVNATLSFNSQREERVNQGGNGNPTRRRHPPIRAHQRLGHESHRLEALARARFPDRRRWLSRKRARPCLRHQFHGHDHPHPPPRSRWSA